jgi:beta-lactam-binding protein with PASTA domain
MPGVVGRPAAEATRLLQQAGFRVEVKEERGSDAPEGIVVAQDPRPGAQAEQGRNVTITVGRPQRSPPPPAPPGPKPKANIVPNVEGMDEKEARRFLQEAGYKVEVEEDEAEGRKGQVIDQRPGAGDTAPAGTTVKIYIGV